MDDYLTKPIQPQALVDSLERWLPADETVVKGKDAPASTLPTEKVLDRAALLDRLMGDEELAEEILGEFIEGLSTELRKLEAAIEKGDGEVIRRIAHTLKGASANVGAVALSNVAQAIEKAGARADFVSAKTTLPGLEQAAEQLQTAARAVVEREVRP
jgi:HPt (histidine-containing phosphotransfer) domain-containing protein